MAAFRDAEIIELVAQQLEKVKVVPGEFE